MSTLAQASDSQAASAFWLNAVQTLTACNMLAVFVPFAIAVISPSHTNVGIFLFVAPFSAPFVWVFLRLAARPDVLTIKRSLALAASWALLILVPSSMLLFESIREGDSPRITANSAIITAIHAALILASIKTYLSMNRESSDLKLLVPRLISALLVLACVLAALLRLSTARY